MTERVTMVTGAAGDLGGAVAARMAKRGDRVVLVDVSAERLAARAAELGGGTTSEVLDVTDEGAVAAMVGRVASRFGRIDSLFNNAGVNGGSYPIAEHPLEDVRRTFEVNVFGIFLMMKHVLPVIAKAGQGWVVNTASEAGLKANERRGVYAATKAAVIQLSRAAALEYGRLGVRVNTLCPGPLEGALMRRSESAMPNPEEFRNRIMAGCSLGRYGKPDEVASFVEYLLTEAPAYLNGAMLLADGCRR